ncbi:MAG: radical SAM protein [Candidatus Omnitrophica bacterium]|nr:radical SAM protein [Candidatus Omnitrophota bacterium]
MRIALIYPSIYESGFNKDGRDIVFNQVHPGLCYLSAVCKKEGFKDITLVDLRTLRGWDDFKEKIRQARPEVAGITMMSPDYSYAMQCVDIIKEAAPAAKIVVGGYHPTIMTDQVAANDKVDHIVVGEGEITFPKLLRRLERGESVSRIIKGEMPDVDSLPFIDRELFDCLELPFDFFLPVPFFSILGGRGCPYNCNFCSPAGKLMHGYRIRRRSVDHVIEELRFLRDVYTFNSLQFWDDCFTEDRGWVMEFCEKYKRSGFDKPFIVQTRADIICKNPDMMKALKKAGLVMAQIGFESGNDRVLKFMNKGTTVKQNLGAARICKSLGIKVWAYNMFGLPTETSEEAQDTVRMIKKIAPYRSSAAFFTPHPGSHFYEYCKKNGLSLIDHNDAFARYPEVDKPKIKGVDYDAMRKLARASKDLSPAVKLRIRIERIFAHKKNKVFRIRFAEWLAKYPSLNKTAVLRMMNQAS